MSVAKLPGWRKDLLAALPAKAAEARALVVNLSDPNPRLLTDGLPDATHLLLPDLSPAGGEPSEAAPGLFAGTIELVNGIERLRLCVVAPTRPWLEARAFADACARAGVDAADARSALAPFAAASDADAERAVLTGLAFVRALSRGVAGERAADDLTDQLTLSFETNDLLYTLARSMRRPGRPDLFIRSACDELRQTLGFGFAGAAFFDGVHVSGPLRGATIGVGVDRHQAAEVRGVLVDAEEEQRICRACFSWARDARLVREPIYVDGSPVGVLFAGEREPDRGQIDTYDLNVFETVAGTIGPFVENAALYEDKERAFHGMMRAFSTSIDAKDRYTRGHSDRVAHVAMQIALGVGLSEAEAERVRVAGIVHDIGKIGVPERILCKPSRLDDDEFAVIKRHPRIGYEILRDVPGMDDVLPGVLHHHERIDGRGYPDGLAGGDIPLCARLLAVADTFDAMSSTRSYRNAMPREKVLAEIARSAGTQLDAELVEAFLKIDLTRYDELVALEGARAEPRAAA